MNSRRDLYVALWLLLFSTVLYAATAGQRLRRPSSDTHFVYQAESFLARRLDLGRAPPHQNDWAEVETLTLRSGRTLSGMFLRAHPQRFRTLSGYTDEIPASEIEKRDKKYYVSFPPFPAVLMLPLVAVLHHRTNDVIFSVVLAGMVPALLYLLLRRLPRALASPTDPAALAPAPDAPAQESLDLWLTLLFGFGSVFYFAAVQGQVWFTAHVVASLLAVLYLLCLWPLRPFACGLLCGALFLTRPQMAAIGLLFVLELWRKYAGTPADPLLPALRPSVGSRLRPLVGPLLWFALPAATLAGLGMAHNYLRFGRLLEFGHTYLQTIQADNIQRFGLMNYQFLPRNLATALTLLPKLLPTAPYLQISYHGLALWFTSPALLYLLWPQLPLWRPTPAAPSPAPRPIEASERARQLRLVLWVTILPIALASLLYQNSGYVQFGYRFSLDYMLLLLVLLRLGSPQLGSSWLFRACVVFGVVINLFGAITFNRLGQFYWNGFFPVN